MSGNKRIALNSLLLYIRLIISTLLGLFTARLVLQNLGASDYGLYHVVGGIVMLLNILNISISGSTHRFIANELGKGAKGDSNSIFNISLVIHLSFALLIFLLAETIGLYYVYNFLNVEEGKLDDAVFVYHFSVLAAILNVSVIPYRGLISAKENFLIRVLIETLSSFMRFIVAFSLIFFLSNKLKIYAVLTALVWGTCSFLYFIYCRIKYKDLVKWKISFKWHKYKEMLSFSAWSLLGSSAAVGNSQGLAMVLNYFFGTVVNASFGIAKQLTGLLITFTQTLNTVSAPQVFKGHGGGDWQRVLQIVYGMSKYTFFLMLLPSVPILLETEFLLKLWLGDVPANTVIFCRVMIIAVLVQTLRGTSGILLNSSGKIKEYETFKVFSCLLCLVVSGVMFHIGFQAVWGLINFALSEVIIMVALMIILKFKIGFDILNYLKKVQLRIIGVLLFSLPLAFITLVDKSGFLKFAVVSLISCVWCSLGIYFIGLNGYERIYLQEKLQSIFYKLFSLRKNAIKRLCL
ncbi:Polysaccharide biosynthesis protein [Sedimentisphaera cyanobacteriorum]|uniref:Polysaccharide biosynthesis protein n=1 Tax=Sedimentisphaera cyanobacteriorum TaxID=1940790 RepID=A0A1Q2HP84_9BACT|nr:oligosaccharide flippase family protein [Sedimentisphaera cyanobacteriorum]AQQ09170.1 Polysaccharide biosynthesis protein [Sedimentisphaera cyanobacteriorum]